jgi:hypothetical protein
MAEFTIGITGQAQNQMAQELSLLSVYSAGTAAA